MRYIQHPQDLHDYINELKSMQRPFYAYTTRGKPPQDTDEFVAWKRVNSFFHRGLVPTYCEFTGLLEPEAKRELQVLFSLIEEHKDYYLVESISGMSLARLNEFCEQVQTHIILNFGIRANDLINIHRKSKIVKR